MLPGDELGHCPQIDRGKDESEFIQVQASADCLAGERLPLREPAGLVGLVQRAGGVRSGDRQKRQCRCLLVAAATRATRTACAS